MSCRRASEIDLLAFAVDRQGPEWASFRGHYPGCPDCARAVASLGDLIAGLAEQGRATAHPDDDLLLAYEDGGLALAERARVEAHLAGCKACRSEVAVLRSFAPEAAGVRAPAAAPAVEERSGFAAWAERLGGWLRPAPAFAAAAAALLALGVAYWSVVRDGGEQDQPQIVEQTPPALDAGEDPFSPSIDGDAPSISEEERSTSRLAEQPAPPPAPSPSPHSTPEPRVEPAPQLAEQPAPPAPPAPSAPFAEPESPPTPAPALAQKPPSAEAEAEPPSSSGEREVVLLAALLPDEMPRFADPAGLSGSDLDVLRSNVVVRGEGGGDARPELRVLAPEHMAVTRSASPRLYWVVDRVVEGSIEIVVNDPDSDAPALAKTIPGPVAAGLHTIDLAAEGVVLRPGRDYEWSVSIAAPGAARDQDVVALAAVRRLEPAGESASPPADEPARARRVHTLASAGEWYAAFDQAQRWAEQAPELERPLAYRRALLDQVGLGEVDAWIEARGRVR